MKKIRTFLILSTTIILFSCNKEDDTQRVVKSDTGTHEEVFAISSSSAYMWYPEGSTITNNGDNLVISPPSDWFYVGAVGTGGINDDPGDVTVSCYCGSGSCDAVSDGDGSADCEANTCTSACVKSTSKEGGSINFTSGGWINIDLTPEFIESGEVFPADFPEMYELSEVQDLLEIFIDGIYGAGTYPDYYPQGSIVNDEAIAPENHVFAPVNIAGRAVFIVVPEDDVPNGIVTSVKTICRCEDEGSCSITIPSNGGNPTCGKTTCDANCKRILSFGIGEEEVDLYSVITYEH